jgi:hypothetical protein
LIRSFHSSTPPLDGATPPRPHVHFSSHTREPNHVGGERATFALPEYVGMVVGRFGAVRDTKYLPLDV